MGSILIRNIRAIVTCDKQDRVLTQADLLAEDGVITAIGPGLSAQADEILDGSHMLCYPGLINTHHHLYQQFSRNLPAVQELELFDWLKALYQIWRSLDPEVVRFSSLTGMGELMKNGCTTCFDHHYVFPRGAGDLLEAQVEAARLLGIRFAASRGSMDLSEKDGGLPPDSVVQTVDEILRDCEAAVDRWHDPRPGAMTTVALAPCSPFSVSRELLRQSAILARANDVVTLEPAYRPGCMQARNRYLVDRSSIVLCYLTESSGGTAYTVRYARSRGVPVLNLAPPRPDLRAGL